MLAAITKMTDKKITISEVNYDAGRKMESYKIEDLFEDKNIGTVIFTGSKYHSAFQAFISLNQRMKLIDKKFSNFIETHKELVKQVNNGSELVLFTPSQNNQLAGKPNLITEHKNIGEEVVYHMRVVLDTLIQLISIELNKNTFESTLKIEIDSIGKLSNDKFKNKPIYKVVFGDGVNLKTDDTDFLTVINELFNSFKHSMFHTETNNIYNEHLPIIVSLFAGYGNLNKGLKYHNHNGYHIIMGFQDCIKRILENFKEYKKSC